MNKEQDRSPVRSRHLSAPVLLLFVAVLLFTALGIWQVKRLAWKEGLIARVEQRVGATPVAAPDSTQLRGLLAKASEADVTDGSALSDMEYSRVKVRGDYIAYGTALVRAVTDRGAGYWVLTPLKREDGRILYINRGFVPTGSKLDVVRANTPHQTVDVVGLLRVNEPEGGFLRSNVPEKGQWYSRDIEAIAGHNRLGRMDADGPVLPYFVDAQTETPPSPYAPIAGLTVVQFTNNHLSYALTWFAMALLSLGAGVWLWRRGSDV